MNSVLFARLKACIRAGLTEITADDITDAGRISLDSTHKPNSKQSGIGSFFTQMGRAGYLRRTDRHTQSNAPYRKKGMIQVWEVTPKGKMLARKRFVPRQ